MPNCRRSIAIFKLSCWARQCRRRDSSGWEEEGCGVVEGAGGVMERLERRVSWTPGAEGAPGSGIVECGWEG